MGAGTFQEGDHSYFYQYLVDENEKTYTLVKKFPISYSSIVSSVQYVDGNVVTSSGMSHCYDEYDAEGNLIRQFNYTAEKYAYRVYKYAFHSFWFE